MHLPKRADDVHGALAAAYNSGDLSTVLGMYDTDGIIVAGAGSPVSGREKFEAAVKSILSIKEKMEIRTVYCLQSSDIAVGRSEWSTLEGDEVKVSARCVEVMKRQADGGWKVLIDHAFGAEANLSA